jgi:uroporphyrinogen decarboxylase
VDAAILYSDIVLPLYAAGFDLDIVPGTGPVIAQPIRDIAGVRAMPKLEAGQLQPITDVVNILTGELDDSKALIGFAGAPFTLASYLIEGGPSRNYEHTKALMHSDPTTWHALLDAIADITLEFLRVQLRAGVDAVQLFDSWAGALPLREYQEFVAPHSAKVLAGVKEFNRPRTHFGVGTGEILSAMRAVGADIVGVDWRIPLDEAVARLVAAAPELPRPVVQGNLDPAILFAGFDVVRKEIDRILEEGKAAAGHIFNLGHGVMPSTDPEILTRVVAYVHEKTQR